MAKWISELIKDIRGNALWDGIKLLWCAGGAALSAIIQAVTGFASGHQNLTAFLVTFGMVLMLLVAAIVISRFRPQAATITSPTPPAEEHNESRVINALVRDATSKNIPSPARDALRIVYDLPGVTYHDLKEKLARFQNAEESAIKPLMRDGLIYVTDGGNLYPRGIPAVLCEVEKKLKLP